MSINPFASILRPYFDWLSSEFDNLADETVKNNVDPDVIARDFLSNEKFRENFNQYLLPVVESTVLKYWKQNSNAINSELARLPGLKARFGGDLGPQRRQRLFERLGIYYDSIVVADPMLRSITMQGPQKWRDYYVLKYGISLILSRDVYLADVYPPIAVLVSEEHLLKETSHYPDLLKHSLFDAIAIANSIFNQNFDTEEDVLQFLKKVGNKETLVREIADTDIFRFDDDVSNDPLEQIEAMDKELGIHFNDEDLPTEMKGLNRIWNQLVGRMMQANELLQQSTDIEAHPVIQAPNSFHWLTTKVRINSNLLEESLDKYLLPKLPVTNALLSKKLEWLSNIPIDELIRLREQGFLNDLRATITNNFSELSTATIDDLERIGNQVDSNLQIALNRHQEQIQNLNKTLMRELSVSVPTLLISIAGAIQPLFGLTPPSWLPFLATVGGTASLKEIISSAAKHISEKKREGKSPIGILWHAREKL